MVYIWIRETVDWADEEAFLAQVSEKFAPRLELWNRTFRTPYHRFRLRVAEIAALNHSRVEGARRAEWEEIPDGSLVLPVDDDDWFAPDAAIRARDAHRPGSLGVRWTTTHVQVPDGFGHRVYLWRRRLAPFSPPAWLCSTNNYAMVKQPGDANTALLASHPVASRWVADGRRESLQVLHARLSLVNRTIASQTTLGSKLTPISRDALLRKLRGYRRLYRRGVRGCPWAAPHLAAMGELMGELETLDEARRPGGPGPSRPQRPR